MNPSNKPALQSDGKNGKEILSFFLKINHKCNRLDWSSDEINKYEGCYFYIDDVIGFMGAIKLPDGYELLTLAENTTVESKESEFNVYLNNAREQFCKVISSFSISDFKDFRTEVDSFLIAFDNSQQQNKKLTTDNERLRECLKGLLDWSDRYPKHTYTITESYKIEKELDEICNQAKQLINGTR